MYHFLSLLLAWFISPTSNWYNLILGYLGLNGDEQRIYDMNIVVVSKRILSIDLIKFNMKYVPVCILIVL